MPKEANETTEEEPLCAEMPKGVQHLVIPKSKLKHLGEQMREIPLRVDDLNMLLADCEHEALPEI